jgi:hypothetical protein
MIKLRPKQQKSSGLGPLLRKKYFIELPLEGRFPIVNQQTTVKPVYNELCYNEFPLITNHIVFTDRIDFFIN